MSEFNLSDKQKHDEFHGEDFFSPEDVKEFIRLESLEILKFWRGEINFEQLQLKRIELAGEKLI